MYRFNNFEEMCFIKYNDRWIAMTKHGDLTKQVTANYKKCDGTYETMVEAIENMVGVDVPNKGFLEAMMQKSCDGKVKAATLTKDEMYAFSKI